ncbi:MAG: FG-GAP-like repeat-containing protein, partial [Bacteroidales bacterium]|nr:FG-GAP-like repeat-containing protein [Bacteroidales bacterium]
WAAPKLCKVGKKTRRIMAGENGSIQGPAERKWGYTVLTVADWDADGKADIIVNSIWGKIQWYRNAGAKDGLTLEEVRDIKVDWPSEAPKPKWNWWDPAPGTLTSQWRTTPVAIDWNKDGILDLVMLDHEGYLAFFEGFVRDGEHILKPGARIFACKNGCVYNNRKGITDKTPGLLRLNDLEAGQSGRRKICFTDWDKDGKLDLIIDGRYGANWFRQMNTGKKGIVHFMYIGALSSTRLEGHTTNPTPVDWNGDGISELLVGAEDGHFYYIPNTMNPQMTIKLYPEGNPSSNGLENIPETIDEKGYVWNISEPRLLVYLPEKDVKPSKAVLVVPGGGYEKCCVTFEGYKTAEYLASRGIAAFVLEYRLPGGHPETILEDGEQAMRIIRSRADEFGIDPGDVGVMGFSAGGHFAATLLTKYTGAQTRPDYGILVYPVISAKYECVKTMDKLLGEAINDPLAAASWSCENNVTSDTPPTMLILCGDDTTVSPSNSKDFYEALISAGVKSQLHILSNGGHGFWMRDRFRYDVGTYHNMTDWIRNWNK